MPKIKILFFQNANNQLCLFCIFFKLFSYKLLVVNRNLHYAKVLNRFDPTKLQIITQSMTIQERNNGSEKRDSESWTIWLSLLNRNREKEGERERKRISGPDEKCLVNRIAAKASPELWMELIFLLMLHERYRIFVFRFVSFFSSPVLGDPQCSPQWKRKVHC